LTTQIYIACSENSKANVHADARSGFKQVIGVI